MPRFKAPAWPSSSARSLMDTWPRASAPAPMPRASAADSVMGMMVFTATSIR